MNKRISQCQKSEIRKSIGVVFLLLGLAPNEIPHEDAQTILISFIQTSFQNILLSDISESFERAIRGDFMVGKDGDLKLYGKPFSAEYFSRVLNAYFEWKRNLPVKQEPPKALLNEDNRTPEQRQDAMLKVHEELTLKLKKVPEPIDIVNCFASLNRNKKLDFSESKIESIRKIADDNIQFDIESLVRSGRSAEAKNARLEKKEAVRLEMKKLFVKEYLLNLISNANS